MKTERVATTVQANLFGQGRSLLAFTRQGLRRGGVWRDKTRDRLRGRPLEWTAYGLRRCLNPAAPARSPPTPPATVRSRAGGRHGDTSRRHSTDRLRRGAGSRASRRLPRRPASARTDAQGANLPWPPTITPAPPC